MKKLTRKQHVLFIVLCALFLITIGYAYLTSTLNINGLLNIDDAKWDVHFEHPEFSEGSITENPPTLDADKTTVSFNVSLHEPGEKYEFIVYVVNDGTIDAMVDTVTSKMNGSVITSLPNYLEYSVTYGDGHSIESNDLLAAGTDDYYKIKVEYKTDIDPSDLPDNHQTLSFNFNVVYVQANNNATRRSISGVLYSQNQNYIHPTDSIIYEYTSFWQYEDGGGEYYSGSYPTEEECLEDGHDVCALTESESGLKNYSRRSYIYDDNVYLKHVVENDILTEQYICFVLDKEYCMKYSNEFSQYRLNKAMVNAYRDYYGEDNINCTTRTIGTREEYWCSGNYPISSVRAESNGYLVVRYNNGEYSCVINASGTSSCRNY